MNIPPVAYMVEQVRILAAKVGHPPVCYSEIEKPKKYIGLGLISWNIWLKQDHSPEVWARVYRDLMAKGGDDGSILGTIKESEEEGGGGFSDLGEPPPSHYGAGGPENGPGA